MIKKIFTISVFLLILVGNMLYIDLSTAESASDELIKWYSYDQGLALAKNQNKPVMIYFTTDWCPHCRNLEQNVFMNEEMAKKLSDNFVCIKVDADKENNLVEKYKKSGFLGRFTSMPVPTVIFADSYGNEVYRIEGEKSAEDFDKAVDEALSRF